MKYVVFKRLLLVLATVLLLPFFVLCQDEDDVIKVDSSIVVVNATIRDAKNQPVSGLKQAQFRIFEDGVEQQIATFESEEAPFAAIVLFDTSGSMEQRISIARSAAINFLDGLRGDDMASIYKFDSTVAEVQTFSGSRDVNDK